MIKNIKKALLLLALGCISAQGFADNTDQTQLTYTVSIINQSTTYNINVTDYKTDTTLSTVNFLPGDNIIKANSKGILPIAEAKISPNDPDLLKWGYVLTNNDLGANFCKIDVYKEIKNGMANTIKVQTQVTSSIPYLCEISNMPSEGSVATSCNKNLCISTFDMGMPLIELNYSLTVGSGTEVKK